MDAFKADAVSLHNLFTSEGNDIGFKVPIYKRAYNWEEENIYRFFEDIQSGLVELTEDANSKTFIGAVILVKEKTSERTFDGTSYIVVDGQQRLTTIVLMAASLHAALRSETKSLADQLPADIKKWIELEVGYIAMRLAGCVYGYLTKDGTRLVPFPKIVREEEDERGTSNTGYRSLVAQYLSEYTKSLTNNEGLVAPSKKERDDGTVKRFKENIGVIQSGVSSLISPPSDEENKKKFHFKPIPPADFQKAEMRTLFAKLPEKQTEQNILVSKFTHEHGDMLGGLLNLMGFASYVLDNILVIRMVAASDKYAFDIFDTLNTTGKSLTAIETLKPKVVQFETSASPGMK